MNPLIAGLGLLSSQLLAAPERNHYLVSMERLDSDGISIVATVNITDGKLVTGRGGAGHLDRGWAHFVRLDTATCDGRLLDIAIDDNSETFLLTNPNDGEPASCRSTLNYSVSLEYADLDWPPGNEQGGRRFSDSLYTVSHPLFLASPGAEASSTVEFHSSNHIDVATAWPPMPDSPDHRTVHVPNNRSLQRNPIVFGNAHAYQIEAKELTVTVALPGPMQAHEVPIGEAMGPIAARYLQMFPNTGRANYLMVVMRDETEDGEAFMSGSAFTTALPVTQSTRLGWANLLAHELLHFWNGALIRTASWADSQWFQEGFTEYLANVTLVNTGLIGVDQFRAKIEQHLGNYRYFINKSFYSDITLEHAGRAKGRNRLGVYSGGWAVAFVLDEKIRRSSGGHHSLASLMRVMLENHRTDDSAFDTDDIARHASRLAGEDLTAFFTEFVIGRTELDLDETLKAYGLTALSKPYANEMYLVTDPTADDEPRRAWDILVNHYFDHLEVQ